ncbi:hypothetical protein B0A50_05596 [Salinomyces thailandicus]|uniref:Uncharacterized protein n=1 Tax=Salinomyces thailandicus TaxID=706561 RepID=A0A4U0TU52_9PEZI|nr:hypothetical protein B0A50_05596 [Salinomyces thailandica]
MAADRPVASADGTEEADLAKAFQELARGERTATALENQLSSMEAKIEELLARAERDQQEAESHRARGTGSEGGQDAAPAETEQDSEHRST